MKENKIKSATQGKLWPAHNSPFWGHRPRRSPRSCVYAMCHKADDPGTCIGAAARITVSAAPPCGRLPPGIVSMLVRPSPGAWGRGRWAPRLLRHIHENIIVPYLFGVFGGRWILVLGNSPTLNYTLCENIMQLSCSACVNLSPDVNATHFLALSSSLLLLSLLDWTSYFGARDILSSSSFS